MTEIRALIFDFNGVILDDEPIHNRNLQRVFAEEGIELSLEEIRARCHGRGDYECFTLLLREAGREPAASLLKDLISQKSRYYRESVRRHLPLVPGVQPFLEHWFGRLPLALASGALPEEIQFVLDFSGLGPIFTVKAYTTEVEAPKPDPAVYRLALERLCEIFPISLAPEACLVFEDSPPGIRAALAAGMRCVGIATSGDYQDLQIAELVVPDFLDARLARLLEQKSGSAEFPAS